MAVRNTAHFLRENEFDQCGVDIYMGRLQWWDNSRHNKMGLDETMIMRHFLDALVLMHYN
jgi:hypothetical protein